eukprot:scaffold73317_cov56-Phaeocystis_antarctica.AAC.2
MRSAAESATLAGSHGRMAASPWGRGRLGGASRVRSAARSQGRGSPQQARAVSGGTAKTAL